jgi:GTP-binding protein
LGSGYLVDLPGYGYAAVPQSTRKSWLPLIEHYLSSRDSLAGLVLVMDARHPLTDLDRQLIDWFTGTGRPILALLTKCDKLSRGGAKLVLDKVRRELSRYPVNAAPELFSAPKKVGLDPARALIMAWLEKNKPPVKGEKTGG